MANSVEWVQFGKAHTSQ